MKSFLLLAFLAAIRPVESAFQRVGTFYVCSQLSPTCNTNVTTNAEIVTASADGNTLIYTDGLYGKIGFVNIVDPTNPIAAGVIDFAPFEPTSVVTRGGLALAAINTSPNFTAPSGFLAVIDIATRTILTNITLPGQPDCITATSTLIAIAIENERDENLNGGNLPQFPTGSVVIINSTSQDPTTWTLINVNVTGLPNVDFAQDAEPEYVAINGLGVVAVTLQENNAVVLIDSAGTVLASYGLGNATVSQVDTVEEKNLIVQNRTINKRREPDGITWIDNIYFATANEGDFAAGGTRGFTIFDSRNGTVVYDSGNEIEWLVARIGNHNEVSLFVTMTTTVEYTR
jgi:hypothetical protein